MCSVICRIKNRFTSFGNEKKLDTCWNPNDSIVCCTAGCELVMNIDIFGWSSIIVFKRCFPSLYPWYFFNRTNGPSFIHRSKLYTPHTPENIRSTSRTYGSDRRRQRTRLTYAMSGNNRTSCIRHVTSGPVSERRFMEILMGLLYNEEY